MAKDQFDRLNEEAEEQFKEEPVLRKAFKDKLDEIDKKTANDTNDMRRQEAFHDLARGIVKIAAGLHGKAKGLAINPELEKPDWERRIDRVIGKGESKKAAATGIYKGEISSLMSRIGRKEKKEAASLTAGARVTAADKLGKLQLQLQGIRSAGNSAKNRLSEKRIENEIRRLEQTDEFIKLQKKRVGISGKSLGLRGEKFVHAKKEKDEPSPTDVRMVGGYNEAIGLLGEIKKDKMEKGIDTGPIANVRNFLAGKVGIDDPKVSTLKQSLVDTLAGKVKTLSGTAASDKERAFLKFSLPAMSDNDEQFIAKLDQAVKNLELAKKAKLDAIQAGGRDVRALQTGAEQEVTNIPKNETKVVGGVTYEKTQGGWKKVK